MLREVDEALCTVVLFVLAVCAAFTIGWLLNLVQEVHRQFWPRDRQPRTLLLFVARLAAWFALPLLVWQLDMKWLWPYSDLLRLFPWVLKDFLDFLEGVRMIAVFVTQLLVSQLAAVHRPVALLSSGAATMFISGRAKLFWTFAVVNTILFYCIRLCLRHRGALPLPGDKAFDVFALSAPVGLLCMAVTPQGSMRHSLWSGVRSAVQNMCARSGYRRHSYNIDSTTAHRQPLHSRSLSTAVSGEFFVTDADTASIPGICITADGSTAPHQAFHHAAGFSDSSQMPKAPASGSNEATGSSLHDAGHAVMHGTKSLTNSNATSTEAEHPNLVCFRLGASCGNVIRLIILISALRAVSMVTRLAQRLWSMQRVQRCVQGVNAGFKGLWAHISSSRTSSALPMTGAEASVPAAATLQASAAPHMTPCNMHQSMAHWFMSGGPPSVRPLHSTVGYSSPAMQQDRVAGGHGNVGAAGPDLDLASDGESEVFEEADAVLQPDLLHTEAPLQAEQTATVAGRSTDDFVGWRKPVAFVRAKLRRTSSVTQMTSTSDVSRSHTRRSFKEKMRAVRRRATPACLSVQ